MTRGIAIRDITTAARLFAVAALTAAALAALPAAAQATVYWANYDHGRIGKAANSGSPASPGFIDWPVGPFGVAAFENTLYWADYDTGSIGKADVSGASAANVDTAYVTGQDGIFAVAANESYVYWGTVGGNIGRAEIAADGSATNVDPDFVTGAGYVEGVAIGDGAIYWTDFDGNRIGRATLHANGSLDTVTTAFQNINGAGGIAYAAGRLYWANSFGTTIGRATVEADGSLSGVNQSFITGAIAPVGLSVLGNDIAWSNSSSTHPPMTSLSHATLAADGSLASVQHEILLDESGAVGVALDAPVDRDPPVVTMTPTAPSSGSWFNNDNSGAGGVEVSVSASDPSGVRALSCSDDGFVVLADTGGAPGTFTLGDGVHHVTCSATDNHRRRNSGAATGSTAFPVTMSIDQSAPAISCQSGPSDWVAFNWFFSCSASDPTSGLADAADASFLVSTSVPDGSEDANAASDTHSVSDVAGNTATSAAMHAKVDRKGPAITCPAPPVLVLGGASPDLVASVSDAGSGPASPTASAPTSSAVAGDLTTTVGAADKVGNRTTVECAYRVEAPSATYQFKGLNKLFRHSFRYGQHIPLHIRLLDSKGKPATNAVARLSVVSVKLGIVSNANSRKTEGDLFRHLRRGHYWYVLDTRQLPGPGDYEVRVTLDDGTVHTAPLRLRTGHGHRWWEHDDD